MIIFIGRGRRFHNAKSLKFTARDLAISSICLNENTGVLHAFIKKCAIIERAELDRLLLKPTLQITQKYVIWENGDIAYFDDIYIDWRTLNIIYVLHVTYPLSATAYQRVVNFNESRALDITLYQSTIQEYVRKLIEHNFNFYSERITYFNLRKVLTIAKRMKIEAWYKNNNLFFRYENIELKDDKGSIFYNEIIVFIKEFQIDGYLLRFDNFDFSSYWGIPVILHPYLSVPYGFNNHLDFLPTQDYEGFVMAIDKMVQGKVTSKGFKSLESLIQDFQDLRKMWAGNKMQAKERIELSKLILEKKYEFDKADV